MIAVLPILLYPLLGISLLQVAQFMQEQPTRVLVVGAEKLARLAAAVRGAAVRRRLFWTRSELRLAASCSFAPHEPPTTAVGADARADAVRRCSRATTRRRCIFPPDFAARLDAFREAIRRRAERLGRGAAPTPQAATRRSKCPVPKSSTTRPATSRSSPSSGFPKCCGAGRSRSATRICEPAACRPRRRSRSRSSTSDVADATRRDGADVVEDSARAAVALGPDRRVLPGHRPLRRRERSAARWKRC